ncbi:MAG: hypothetical protein IT427_18235 [Pirellulales bacterium]|nr:hypothetical protein [Pirellulales bacterium]
MPAGLSLSAFASQEVTTTPKDGKWKVELAPLAANLYGNDLVVKQGDQTVTRKNLVVGDVWLCGGQSNMHWQVDQSADNEESLAMPVDSNLRLFTVRRRGKPQPLDTLEVANGRKTAPKRSATLAQLGTSSVALCKQQ